jgi:hypothetical protein
VIDDDDGARDAKALFIVFDADRGFGVELGWREAGALQPKRHAIVKHPACAAAFSSSGLMPFSFSKRVRNEYGVCASTPESVVSVPLPARPVLCQTAFAFTNH